MAKRNQRRIVVAAVVMGLIALINLVQGGQGVLHATPGTGLYAVSLRNLALGSVMVALIYQVVWRRSILSLVSAALLIVGTGIVDFFVEKPDPEMAYNGVSLFPYIFGAALVVRLLIAAVILRALPGLRRAAGSPSSGE